jgi:hypothetical protein
MKQESPFQVRIDTGDTMRVHLHTESRRGKFHEILGYGLVVSVLLCLWAGCKSRHPAPPPKVSIVGVQQFGEYPFGQVLTPDVVISNPGRAKMEVQIELNNRPYIPKTPIREPGGYQLSVWVASDEALSYQLVLHEFWILLPVEVHTLKWAYRPHPNGFADVEAEFLVYSPANFAYSVQDIYLGDCELHISINSKLYKLSAYQMAVIQSPYLPRGEAGILKFRASHESKKIPAGKIEGRPAVRGQVKWRDWFTYFKEEVSLSKNSKIEKELKKGYKTAMTFGGS